MMMGMFYQGAVGWEIKISSCGGQLNVLPGTLNFVLLWTTQQRFHRNLLCFIRNLMVVLSW